MKNSSVRLLSLCVVFFLFLVGCGAADTRADNAEVSAQNPSSEQESAENMQLKAEAESEDAEPMLQMKIGETPVTVEWEENESVEALKELCLNAPLTIQMSMYGGFEQVGPIGQSLPREDRQTTTQAGDIVLYSGSQIVVFYGSNSWAYTRLGKIADKSAAELKDLLGNGDVTITLTWE